MPRFLKESSASGGSLNVLRAAKAAHRSGMQMMAYTGEGGHLADMVDLAIAIPSRNTQHIQETHLAPEHTICEIVEREFLGGSSI